MDKTEPPLRPDHLARMAAQARSQSAELRALTVKTTRQAAETELVVADTLAELAVQHPRHAGYLRAISQAARQQTARQREWADRHAQLQSAGRRETG